MCMCVYVCARTRKHVLGRPEVGVGYLPLILSSFWEGLLLNPEPEIQTGMTGQWTPGDLQPPPSAAELQIHKPHLAFHAVLLIWIQVFMLAQRAFTHSAISPACCLLSWDFYYVSLVGLELIKYPCLCFSRVRITSKNCCSTCSSQFQTVLVCHDKGETVELPAVGTCSDAMGAPGTKAKQGAECGAEIRGHL